MKCACVQLAFCADFIDADFDFFFVSMCLFLVGISGFISLQVLDTVLEDLKKEHPDAISVVWLQCVATIVSG